MNFKNKNILITGLSGFIGSNLAKYLLNQGANVYGIIRKRADGTIPQNILDKGITETAHLIEGDLTNISSLAFALDESEPDMVFHLAAQSFVQRSFQNPIETVEANVTGTSNLLEAIRLKNHDPKIIFAGSSEEYGLVISSEKQLKRVKERYESIFPEPEHIPELPINEKNPLRPMSPYAVSKVYGDFLMRNYYHSYGMKTVVSRGFNHEGAGRGKMFVTSSIVNQVMKLKFGETDKIIIGNVNAFRDWSHVDNIIKGYCLLAEKGINGEVYNQGSQRTNSVLSYMLLALEVAGFSVKEIETLNGAKKVKKPIEIDNSDRFGIRFEKTLVDKMILDEEISFDPEDRGIYVHGDNKILIEFNQKLFRPAEVPILLSDTRKIQKLGYKIERSLTDIINDQINFFMDAKKRS